MGKKRERVRGNADKIESIVRGGFAGHCKLLQYGVGKLVREFIANYPDLERFELDVLVGRPGVCVLESGAVTTDRLVQVAVTDCRFVSGGKKEGRHGREV